MNVHYLELFYYVARYKGILAASRNMPYGVQQPAISSQIGRLEESLGVQLFQRRPFRLTEQGEMLYEYIAPFFSGLDTLGQRLRGEVHGSLRLAGLSEVMREHVPELIAAMREKEPNLRIQIYEIDQRGAEKMIREGEADLAITVLESGLSSGFQSCILADLPLVLLLPRISKKRQKNSPSYAKIKTATEALRAGEAGEFPLISLPAREALPNLFQAELLKRSIRWETSIEASSQDLVLRYASLGLGVGLGVLTPEIVRSKKVVALPLKGFSSMKVGVFWRGNITPAGRDFLKLLQSYVGKLLREGAA
ncbi:MAG: LysR substrate-binding domain-containing protein [Chthoniobacterales bacterium]